MESSGQRTSMDHSLCKASSLREPEANGLRPIGSRVAQHAEFKRNLDPIVTPMVEK